MPMNTRNPAGSRSRRKPVATMPDNALRLFSLTIGAFILGVPLFLANDPHGLHTLRVLQWLMPDPGGGNTIVWMNAWTTLAVQSPAPRELATAFLFGLVVGGFVNVVITRTPPREAGLARSWAWAELDYIQAADRELENLPPDFATGRSLCIHCRTPIPGLLATPVIGWLWLRGRTACCDRPIPARYPVVEILTAVLFTLVHWRFGYDPVLPAALVVASVLVALAVIDIEHLVLPDMLVLPLLWYGLAANIHGGFVTLDHAVIGAISGYCIFRVFREGWFRVSGRAGIGLGDCKLAAAIGAWAGIAGFLQIAILAAGGALVTHGFLVLIGRSSLGRLIPFGPWLAGAGIAWLLFPDAVSHVTGQLG